MPRVFIGAVRAKVADFGLSKAAIADVSTNQSVGLPPIGSHNYLGHNYLGHFYVGHNYGGHNYIGHKYLGDYYIGHNYVGHNCVGPQLCRATTM